MCDFPICPIDSQSILTEYWVTILFGCFGYRINRTNGKITHSFILFTMSVTCNEAEPASAATYKSFLSGLAMYTAVMQMEVIGQVQDH
jgi:hypothetical protein